MNKKRANALFFILNKTIPDKFSYLVIFIPTKNVLGCVGP